MAATTQWVQYNVNATTLFYTGGTTPQYTGNRGWLYGSAVGSTFTITSGNNQLMLAMDGGASKAAITLPTGSGLDPRYLARYITESMHNLAQGIPGATGNPDNSWHFASCAFTNGAFKIYSGGLGSASAVAAVNAGSSDARSTLGLTGYATGVEYQNPSVNSGANRTTNVLTVTGTYLGARDDIYTIFVGGSPTIPAPLKVNNVTCTPAGVYNNPTTATYSITISTAAGTKSVTGAGAGQVPQFTVSTTGISDGNSSPTDILYANQWVDIGSMGLRVKFDDFPFIDGDVYTITCSGTSSSTTSVVNSNTPLVIGSRKGDIGFVPATNVTQQFAIGSKGLYGVFTGSDTMYYGDQWRIVCRGPQPYGGVTTPLTMLNFGNITVSSDSAVQPCMFEIISGAVSMNSVKFTLFSHGLFQYHNPLGGSSYDTAFHFGTVGDGAPSASGYGWKTGVTAADITPATISTPPPVYLTATNANLSVVSTADAGQTIGVADGGMVSDFIFLGLHMGANETGANSQINYRMYFDYV